MPLSRQQPPDNYTRPAWLLALLLWLALGLGGWQLLTQLQQLPPQTSKDPHRSSGSRNQTQLFKTGPLQGPPAPETLGPQWSALSPAQQQALQPLTLQWPLLTLSEKNQWLTLVVSFSQLPTQEQAKLHARMAGWARLTPQQRKQARLNFSAANAIAPANKRAQWDAYQSLSDAEKQRLATSAAPKPSGAAVALRPTPPQKLLRIPAPPTPAAPPLSASPSAAPPPVSEPVVVETMSITTPSAQGTDLPPLPAADPGTDTAAPAAPTAPTAPAAPESTQ